MPTDWRTIVPVRKASFRGVEFGLQESERGGGRKFARHGFPNRDRSNYEDLGRDDRTFRVEGFVNGDDYIERRDELIAALEKPGLGGNLVHPFYGVRPCFSGSYSVAERAEELGVAFFSMTFFEVGDPIRVQQRGVAPVDGADAAAQDLEDSGEAHVVDELHAAGEPEPVRQASADVLQRIGSTLQRLNVFRGPSASVALLQRRITGLIASAQALATDPADLASQVLGAVRSVTDAAAAAPGALFAYRALLAQVRGDPSLVGGSRTQRRSRENSFNVAGLARWAALAGAARAAVRISWPTYEEALEARDELLELLDQELAEAPEGAVSEGLLALRLALGLALPSAFEDLPRLLEVTLQEDLPALVLAHRVYGDADRDLELVERNRVPDPNLLPRGDPLSLLSR